MSDGMLTMAISLLFFLGLLWAGWLNGLRQWIHGKVSE